MKEKVAWIKIGGDGTTDEFGWVQTKSGNLYYLWWLAAYPRETTAVHHVRRSLWISLLRDAMANNWDVEFTRVSNTSPKILNVKVFAP